VPLRRRSTRLQDHDYASPGAYFVTVCTKGRECIFGEVEGDEVRLTREGKAAAACWLDIPQHFPHVELDQWVVMPNHLHGILLIGGRGEAFANRPEECEGSLEANASPLRISRAHGTNRQSLGAIIQNYKSVSTRLLNRAHGVSGKSIWQRNYYEHVIRGDEDLARIRRYIAGNPARWDLDEENPRRQIASRS
jgi:REP element-mobilizing transposase RayT